MNGGENETMVLLRFRRPARVSRVSSGLLRSALTCTQQLAGVIASQLREQLARAALTPPHRPSGSRCGYATIACSSAVMLDHLAAAASSHECAGHWYGTASHDLPAVVGALGESHTVAQAAAIEVVARSSGPASLLDEAVARALSLSRRARCSCATRCQAGRRDCRPTRPTPIRRPVAVPWRGPWPVASGDVFRGTRSGTRIPASTRWCGCAGPAWRCCRWTGPRCRLSAEPGIRRHCSPATR